jgi:hypothetical protein
MFRLMPRSLAQSSRRRRRKSMAEEMGQLDEGERIRRWGRGQTLAEERQRTLPAAEGPRPAHAVAESLSRRGDDGAEI